MQLRKTGLFFTGVMLAALPDVAMAGESGGEPVAAEAEANGDTEGVAEITVTARRVSEGLQSTPIAITALGGAMLDQISAADTIDLSGRAPNVQIVQTGAGAGAASIRSEEHTSELQSLMRISYAVFCLKKTNKKQPTE